MSTATLTKPRKASKPVEIVSRVSLKNADRPYVVYTVRSSNGVDTYHTTLVNGHATGCDCPARKPCKHMAACESNEATRSTDQQQHVADDLYSCYDCGYLLTAPGYCHKHA